MQMKQNAQYWCCSTPYRRVLIKELAVAQLIKKFPPFYETRRFISIFTKACDCTSS
jgi:hypothetical protein